MTAEKSDIYQAAYRLICRHGEGACAEGAKHADACLARDDLIGAVTWGMILRAIRHLQGRQQAGETVN